MNSTLCPDPGSEEESDVAKEKSVDVLSELDGILKLKGLHHSCCYLAQLAVKILIGPFLK